MKLLNGLYAYFWNGYENNCNTFLLVGDTMTLIDPGHLAHFQTVERQMSEDGFAVIDIDLVLVTHCHPDHIEAVAHVCEVSGAKFALHETEYEFGRTIGLQLARALGMELPDLTPSFLLQEGSLVLGHEKRVHLEVVQTPGHSPGSLCFYWPERRALISGDLVFAQGVGRTDFPGGDIRELVKSISRVAQLDVAYLLPGHGPQVEGSDEVLDNYKMIARMFGFSKGS